MNETANREPDDGEFLALQQRVKGSNIDETTLLATDYLNHFNEIVMLLEMVPDMPEMLEEVKAFSRFPANRWNAGECRICPRGSRIYKPLLLMMV